MEQNKEHQNKTLLFRVHDLQGAKKTRLWVVSSNKLENKIDCPMHNCDQADQRPTEAKRKRGEGAISLFLTMLQ